MSFHNCVFYSSKMRVSAGFGPIFINQFFTDVDYVYIHYVLFFFAAKKKLATTTAGLLERRNVRFETPSSLSDHPNGIGNGNGGAVPPSPNTRRMAFNLYDMYDYGL